MKKQITTGLLALGLAFSGMSYAHADQLSHQEKLDTAKEELKEAQEEYDVLIKTYRDYLKQTELKPSKILDYKEDVDENSQELMDIALKFDKYVKNGVPSIDQVEFRSYLETGAIVNGHTIRKGNKEDLYYFLVDYYQKSDDYSKKDFEDALWSYVQAVGRTFESENIYGGINFLTESTIDAKKKLDDAKKKVKALEDTSLKERLKESIHRAEVSMAAAKKLIKTTPDLVKDHLDELNKLISDQEALIKKANKVLESM